MIQKNMFLDSPSLLLDPSDWVNQLAELYGSTLYMQFKMVQLTQCQIHENIIITPQFLKNCRGWTPYYFQDITSMF